VAFISPITQAKADRIDWGAMPRLGLIVLLALPSGCGADGSEPVTPPAPPSCGDFEMALPDGTCFRPGIEPGACSEGFEHDGGWGCVPILPAEPCPPGLVAVPGDTQCRPVMPCGAGQWGTLPVDGTTQHVDGAYAGGDSNGSAARPWTTIGEAYAAAAPGALVAVAAGSYGEAVAIVGKPVRLWGVCPDRVAILGQGSDAVTLTVRSGADGTEIGGLSISGATHALVVTGAQNVLVDRVWVHDNGGRGVNVESTLGPASVELRGSLIEQNHEYGVMVAGSTVTVDGSVVRTTQPGGGGQTAGRGINIQLACTDTPSGLQCDPFARSLATLRRSVVEDNHEYGLLVSGSDATVEATVVRRTLPSPSDQMLGVGVSVQVSCVTTPTGQKCDLTTASSAAFFGSLIEQNYEVGLLVMGSHARMDRSVVRATLPRAADQESGRGINVRAPCYLTDFGQQCDTSARSTFTLFRSLVEDNHKVGVYAAGADVTVDGSVIRATLPITTQQTFGRGMEAVASCTDPALVFPCLDAERSLATIFGTLIEQNNEVGLGIIESDATVTATVVRATSNVANRYGDGVQVVGGGTGPALATIDNVWIDGSARAGLASYGGSVAVSNTQITCAAFELEGGAYLGNDDSLVDHGGNRCGCPAADGNCTTSHSDLEAPDPIGAIE